MKPLIFSLVLGFAACAPTPHAHQEPAVVVAAPAPKQTVLPPVVHYDKKMSRKARIAQALWHLNYAKGVAEKHH